jgi:hypothetical protein
MALYADLSIATLLGLASPALAEDCRLALVLAIDVSGSITSNEDRLQREGLARALLAPEVERAFLMGEPVAVFVFQWAGPSEQFDILSGWHMVETHADLAGISEVVAQSRGRPEDLSTAIGGALDYAASVLPEGPACTARTVDIASDGRNNSGSGPGVAYEDDLFDHVTVNAVVITDGLRNSVGLVAWFEAHVLHGTGAFFVLADGYEDYERAMTVKLLRELALPLVSGWPTSPDAG